MNIVFVTNFVNHHQVHVADELFRLTNGCYHLIETVPLPEEAKRAGYPDFSSKPYVLQTWRSEKNKRDSFEICKNSDVVLFNSVYGLEYGIRAAKKGKICFEVGERWLKKGFINLLSPRLLKNLFYYHILLKRKKTYRLCCSAYAAKDQYKLFAYRNKCYKWGYFTKIDDLDIKSIINSKDDGQIKIMWCARFIGLKHPEMAVKLASKLKNKYNFIINMYGVGEMYEYIKDLIKELGVNDYVKLHGSLANDEILRKMRHHDIFLFTSDRNEGWGAVANEVMSNGCAIVGSDRIGSIPFLVEDGRNGCIFKSEDIESLTEKVEWLINNPKERKTISVNAYYTMKEFWSPANAANNLLMLIENLKNEQDTSIKYGPCSKALPI